MAFNGSGVFTRLYNWVTEQASSPIEIAKLDTQEEDFATALNNCLTRDGQGKPSADINWNSKDLTGVDNLAAASATITTLTAGLTASTATATLTGCTTAPTVTASFQKIGRLAIVIIPSVTATSNSTSMSITCTFPSGFAPTSAKGAISFATDNGARQLAAVNVTSGVFAFYITPFSGNDFTSSGTKGLPDNTTLTYYID
jgi:hypothetical protein